MQNDEPAIGPILSIMILFIGIGVLFVAFSGFIFILTEQNDGFWDASWILLVSIICLIIGGYMVLMIVFEWAFLITLDITKIFLIGVSASIVGGLILFWFLPH